MKHTPQLLRDTSAGLLFAMLWSSASVTTKIGIVSIEPLVLAFSRYIIAGILMLGFVFITTQNGLPNRKDWKPIFVLGLLNITFYSACFVLAIQQVAASVGSLSMALNPLFITVFAALWHKRPVQTWHWVGLILGILGIITAVFPFLLTGYATPTGLVLLLVSRILYSVAAVYYGQLKFQTSPMLINTWQTLLGGLCLVPFVFWFHTRPNHFTPQVWGALAWLIVPVAIVATRLWLYLLKIDVVQASFWQFVCPIFGILYAYIFLGEPLSVYTLVGGLMVCGSIYFSRK